MDEMRAAELDLQSCLRIAKYLFNQPSLDEFLRLVLQEALNRVKADRGSIFLLERDRRVLRGFAMTGIERPQDVTIAVDQGIVGHVVSTGESLNIRDAYADKRFFKEIDTQTGYRTSAILCLPIMSSSANLEEAPGTVLGVMELLNPVDKEFFSEQDERSVEATLAFASVRLREYSVIEGLLKTQERLEREVANFRGYADDNNVLARLVGSGPTIEKLKQMIWTIAPYDSNVLIQGESGTGKELVAQCIHALSSRRKGPFVAINCAAVPEFLLEAELFGIESGVATGVSKRIGRIEQANGGTFFLDEIGEMPPAMQAKMLRVLQEKEIVRLGGKEPIPVNVRVVGATHRQLAAVIGKGEFREDLFYRLNVVEVRVPPLRERREDIPFLARYFLEKLNEKYYTQAPKTIATDALVLLQQKDWPGNIRQLQNEIERLFILVGHEQTEIIRQHILVEGSAEHENGSLMTSGKNAAEEGVYWEEGWVKVSIKGLSLSQVLSKLERLLVSSLIKLHGGNKTKVATQLGISREGLRKMLLRWDDESRRPG